MTIGVTAGVNFSYDEAFEARVLENIKVRFDGPSATSKRVEAQQHFVVSELISTPTNRSVWIHDAFETDRGALAAICIYKKGKITSKTYVSLSKITDELAIFQWDYQVKLLESLVLMLRR